MPPSRVWVGLALSRFEGEEEAAAHLGRVVHRFEPRRYRLPLLVTEIRVGRAGREDEIIVRDPRAFGQDDLTACRVHVHDLAQPHLCVRLLPEDSADGARDVGWREGRRGDLVEQGLKEVEVPSIDEREPDGRLPECSGAVQASEAAADDHDMRGCHEASRGVGSDWIDRSRGPEYDNHIHARLDLQVP